MYVQQLQFILWAGLIQLVLVYYITPLAVLLTSYLVTEGQFGLERGDNTARCGEPD